MEGKNLKKNKIILFIATMTILIVIFVLIYRNISNSNNTQTQEEKAFTEIEFLDGELVNLFNQMNNIEIRNYNVSVTQINEKGDKNEEDGQANKSEESKNSNSSSESNNTSGGSSKDSSSGNSTESTDSSLQNSQNGNSTTKNEEFQLQSTSVLLRSDQIDWDEIKTKIETLDLYQIQVNQDDILNFNKELDSLTLLVEQERKEECLNKLATIYEYIPKFAEKATTDELEKTILETKKNLFKGYSKLDSKNWSEISQDVNQTVESFTKLLTNVNEKDSKQYTINKIYVMLNELKNAVNIQDTNVFLIKYKNILEELNDL